VARASWPSSNGKTYQIQETAIKDYKRGKDANGQWEPQFCPLGEGMVHFNSYFTLLKEAKFSGPIQLHYEYPLGVRTRANEH
jgi:sugar phosphate isomerase/epimerase